MKRATRNLLVSGLVGLLASGTLIAGIEGGGITSRGSISRFTSVVMNGIEYATNNVNVTINSIEGGGVSDLEVGQIITLSGVINNDLVTGDAADIVYESDFRGDINATTSNSINLLGTTVLVDIDTQFESTIQPPSIAGLSAGNKIQVSGLVTNGAFVASWIGRDFAPGVRSSGVVSNLNAATQEFSLDGLTVSFSGVSIPPDLANGDRVLAQGGLDAQGRLVATQVNATLLGVPANPGDQIGLEGFISVVGLTTFTVNDQIITTDGETIFKNGGPADLVLGTRVAVDGALDANSVVVAARIDFRNVDNLKLAGTINSINTSTGFIRVLGTDVTISDLTEMEDKSETEVPNLSIDDLSLGDYVEVEGHENPRGTDRLVARDLERDDFESKMYIQGFLNSAKQPEFELIGTTIRTTANTNFEDVNRAPLTASQFFTQAPGKLVKAKGFFDGQVLIAEEIEMR